MGPSGTPGGYYEPHYEDQAWYPEEGVSMQAQEGDRPDQYDYVPHHAQEQTRAPHMPSQSSYTPNSGYTQTGRSRPGPQRSYNDSGDRQAHGMNDPRPDYEQNNVRGVHMSFSDSAPIDASSKRERSNRAGKYT